MIRRLLSTTLAVLLLLTGIAVSCPRTTMPAVEAEVNCPVCKTSLAVAQSPQAERERHFIQQLIDKCQSKDQIKTALKAEYGAAVLAIPSERGLGTLSDTLPIIFLTIALLLTLVIVWRWRRQTVTPAGDDEL